MFMYQCKRLKDGAGVYWVDVIAILSILRQYD